MSGLRIRSVGQGCLDADAICTAVDRIVGLRGGQRGELYDALMEADDEWLVLLGGDEDSVRACARLLALDGPVAISAAPPGEPEEGQEGGSE